MLYSPANTVSNYLSNLLVQIAPDPQHAAQIVTTKGKAYKYDAAECMINDLKQKGKDAYYFSDTDLIVDFLKDAAKPEDVILVMSNGGFDNIHARLLERLE